MQKRKKVDSDTNEESAKKPRPTIILTASAESPTKEAKTPGAPAPIGERLSNVLGNSLDLS